MIAANLQLFLALARRFKTEYGANVHIYVRAPEEKRGIERLDKEGLIDSVNVSQKVTPALRLTVEDEGAVIAKAQDWECRIGETFNRLAFEHRHLSRGYFPGGSWVPRSPLVKNSSYVQMLNGFNYALDFWSNEIESKRLSLLVGADKSAIAVCRLLGVPYRRLFSSKFGDGNYWATDEKGTNQSIERIYDELTDLPDPGPEFADMHQHLAKIARHTNKLRILTIASGIFESLTKGMYLRLFGSQAGQVGVIDSVAVHFNARRNFKLYKYLARTRIEDLDGAPFIYFPLQKEPETNMLAASPEYFNQTSAIMSISRDLPAGVRLAIKEHIPSFTARSPGFYQNIADLKPVIFVDAFESSHELIRRAVATVTITGAAGLEATAMGKPVIQFGRHMMNNFVPHVMTVTDEDQLRSYIEKALNGGIDPVRARLDGRRFREALRLASFEMADFNIGSNSISCDSVSIAHKKLLESL